MYTKTSEYRTKMLVPNIFDFTTQTCLYRLDRHLEMWDEIFKFESFINFVNFLKYFKTPFLKFSLKFCILIIIHR